MKFSFFFKTFRTWPVLFCSPDVQTRIFLGSSCIFVNLGQVEFICQTLEALDDTINLRLFVSIYLSIYLSMHSLLQEFLGGVISVNIIILGNGIGDPISNPGRGF